MLDGLNNLAITAPKPKYALFLLVYIGEKNMVQRSRQTKNPIWVGVQWEPKQVSVSLLDPYLYRACTIVLREGKEEESALGESPSLTSALSKASQVWIPGQPTCRGP